MQPPRAEPIFTLYLSIVGDTVIYHWPLVQSFRRPVTSSIECVPVGPVSACAVSTAGNEATGRSDRLARFAARGLAAREVVQVHVHLAAVFDRRGCVAAEATTDGVGDDTWLGLGLGLGFRDRDRAMVRVWSGLDERD